MNHFNDREKVTAWAAKIDDTIEALLRRSQEAGKRPEKVADRMVEEKLAT